MTADGASFALDMTRFAEKAKVNMDIVVRKVIFDVSASVIKMSPVDTGRFRNNWQYGEANMPGSSINEVDKNADSVSARIFSMLPANAAGKVHYIVNNLPYSIRLEYGWSKQAPGGMVRVTLQRYQDFFNKAVAELP